VIQAGLGMPEGDPRHADPVDRALRVTVSEKWAESVGAVLMDWLGPFQTEVAGACQVTLVFYPPADTFPNAEDLLSALPEELRTVGEVSVASREVPRDWVEGWRDHFRPIVIDQVRVRPPWESALPAGGELADVVINPGLGFGTGLHPTTRGVLHLLQNAGNLDGAGAPLVGPLVDAGTGSGILAIAAAKLGWGPVFAFDNDPAALESTRANVAANGVEGIVEVHLTDVAGASLYWFSGATVLANMTLEPVLALVRRLGSQQGGWGAGVVPGGGPARLVVSGILEGAQERELQGAAKLCGFALGRRVHEGEWVSLELLPARPPHQADGWLPTAFGG
jgi:ribosomal protein L11 methyltransferase